MDRINRASFSPSRMPDEAEAVFPGQPIADIPQNMAGFRDNRLQSEYPGVYFDLFPLVAEAAQNMISDGYAPTTEMLNSIVDTILKNSGMWYEDDDDLEAIPAQFGFSQAPFRRRGRRYHNRNTLRDIIRILLLRELLDGRNQRRF